MTLFQAVILGIVQGAGEFLPISSSAHLVIVPWLFDFPDPGLTFDVALHLGTLLSLLAYFYRDWLQLAAAFFRSLTRRPSTYGPEEKLIWFLVVGTIPAAAAGYFLENYAETIFRSPALVATMMAVMGLILFLADRYGKKQKRLDQVSFWDSLVVGCSQALSLIPGTSRSGVTITAGLFRRMDRPTAARFSFLLSMPITAGAVVFKFKEFLYAHIDAVHLTGIAVSAVVGYLSIKYMLYFLQKYSYGVYVWYRWAFAAVVFLAIYLKK